MHCSNAGGARDLLQRFAIGSRAAAHQFAHNGHLRKARANVVVQICRNPGAHALERDQLRYAIPMDRISRRQAEDRNQGQKPSSPPHGCQDAERYTGGRTGTILTDGPHQKLVVASGETRVVD